MWYWEKSMARLAWKILESVGVSCSVYAGRTVGIYLDGQLVVLNQNEQIPFYYSAKTLYHTCTVSNADDEERMRRECEQFSKNSAHVQCTYENRTITITCHMKLLWNLFVFIRDHKDTYDEKDRLEMGNRLVQGLIKLYIALSHFAYYEKDEQRHTTYGSQLMALGTVRIALYDKMAIFL